MNANFKDLEGPDNKRAFVSRTSDFFKSKYKAAAKAKAEDKSDTISHQERSESKGSMLYAEYLGTPLNVHLTYNVTCQDDAPGSAVETWRTIYRKIATYLTNKGIEPKIISTRRSDLAPSLVEEHHHLVHVPDQECEDFVTFAGGLIIGMTVTRLPHPVEGTTADVFEHMFRAASASSIKHSPGIKVEPSGLIVGPMVFRTRNLWAKNWPTAFKDFIIGKLKR